MPKLKRNDTRLRSRGRSAALCVVQEAVYYMVWYLLLLLLQAVAI